jgi:hypothetical protein
MTTNVAIILLNWNNWADTVDCLGQLRQADQDGLSMRIIVVDNGSSQPMPLGITDQPDVQFIEMGFNAGFAAGNNAGIRQALAGGAQMVLLVNTDTILPPGFLRPLAQRLLSNPQAGIVCPKMYLADQPEIIWFAGGKFREPRLLGEMLGMGQRDTGQFDTATRMDFAVGTCMLIRPSVFDAVGLLDELFFFYHEDVDFSLRTRAAGFEIWFEPASKMYHRVAQSTKSDPPLRVYHYNRARTALLLKHIRGKRILPALGLDLLRFLRQGLGFVVRGQFDQAAALVRGIWDGLRAYANRSSP